MVVTDPIADMLTRVRNAIQIKASSVEMPSSKVKMEIARVLKEDGFIYNFDVSEKGVKKTLKLVLKYNNKKKNVINGLKIVSTSGRHVYKGASDLPRIQGGFGSAIISTSKGIMTEKTARKTKVGGEVICYVW